MTEDRQWLTVTDPAAMLAFLRARGKVSERKFRMFATACVRSLWPWLNDGRSRKVVKVSEQYADAVVSASKLAAVLTSADRSRRELRDMAASTIERTAGAIVLRLGFGLDADLGEVAREVAAVTVLSAGRTFAPADLLRDIFGNPFHVVSLDPARLSRHAHRVTNLAASIYEERLLSCGHFDNQKLGVLADALEEAGAEQEVVRHLREKDGVHVRGCWVVDLLLGKE